eukprot:gene11169-biopygen19861
MKSFVFHIPCTPQFGTRHLPVRSLGQPVCTFFGERSALHEVGAHVMVRMCTLRRLVCTIWWSVCTLRRSGPRCA